MADLYASTHYQENQVLTAAREHVLLLAYDGAIRFCRTAREYMKAGRLYEQHTQIVKAQAILSELIGSIDHSVAPELGRRLESIYHYLYGQLVQANVQDDVQALTRVIDSLSDLREAWAEAATRWRAAGPGAPS
jgi:flagellar protein FliS